MRPRIIGRAPVLRRLDALVDSALEQGGGLACIVGDPGIGKSTLLGYVDERLRARVPTRRVAALDEPDRRRHLAVGRAWYPGDVGRSVDPVDAVAAAVEDDAKLGVVALLVDNLQWADSASADLVDTLAGQAGALGCVLVASMRPWPTSRAHQRLLDRAERGDGVIRLQALDDEAVAELVLERTGGHPSAHLLDRLAAANGNPFLLGELVDQYRSEDRLDIVDGTVELRDGTISADLAHRLAGRVLGTVPGSVLALRTMAAVPGWVGVDELAAILGVPFADMWSSMTDCIAAGLLVDVDRGVAFRHELLRHAVMEDTAPSMLRSISRRAAEELSARGADPERVVSCLLVAPNVADAADRRHLLAVARELRESHPEAAADLYRWCLAANHEAGEPIAEVLDELGWVLAGAGRAGEVEELIETYVGPFRIDDPLPVQRLRGVAASLCGAIDRVVADYAPYDWREIASRYDRNDPDAIDAIAELAQLRVSTGAVVEATEIADWVEAAPAPPTAQRTITVACVRSLVQSATGQFSEAAASARNAIATAQAEGGALVSDGSAHLLLAVALDHLGHGDAALTAARAKPSPRMPRWAGPLMQSFVSVALFRRGDWDDALAEVDVALATAADIDAGLGAYWAPSVGALIATARGDLEAAALWLDRARVEGCRLAMGKEWMATAHSELLEAGGRIDDAAALAEMATTMMIESGCIALLVNGGPQFVRVCLEAGRHQTAKQICITLADIAGRSPSPPAAAVSTWASGLLTSDAAALAGAGAMLSAAGRMPQSAAAFADAAVVASRRGSHTDARQLARNAFERFDLLGAEGWAQRLRTGLAPVGVTVRRPRRAPRPLTGWDSLTPSERRVVEMVGNGQTNSEIAAELVISRRTVESHLVRVYAKLQFTGRTQLAAAAARRAADRTSAG